MKVALIIAILVVISCSNTETVKESESNSRIEEIINCVLNSPELYTIGAKIFDLVKERKFDEIRPVFVEFLMTLATKSLQCAFPNCERNNKLEYVK